MGTRSGVNFGESGDIIIETGEFVQVTSDGGYIISGVWRSGLSSPDYANFIIKTTNKVNALHQGDGVWRISENSDFVQSVNYSTIEVSKNNYNISKINQNNQSTQVIWDQLEVDSVGVSDNRVDVGEAVEVRFALRYDYDDTPFTGEDGSVTISGSAATYDEVNGWWERTFAQSSSVTSTNYDENDITFTDTVHGLTAIEDDAGANLVTDQIIVHYEAVDDSRVNVGDSIKWRVKAVLDYDDHILGSGDSLTGNLGALSWDEGNDWWEISHSESTVTGTAIGSWSGSEATYGITAISENITETTGIWDRIKILTNGTISTVSNLQTEHLLWVKAVYSYDNSSFTGSDGSLFMNSSECTWNNNRWELTVTQEETGTRNYQVSSVNDSTYGLTSFNDLAGPLTVERAGEWTVQLDVTLGETFTDLIFGVSETATRLFDTEHDDIVPPMPPSGIYAYLWEPENPTGIIDMRKMSKSINPISYPATWEFRVQSISVSGESTVSWDSSAIQGIPENQSVMLETPSGDVNMRLKDSHTWTVETGETYSFSIVVSPQAVISLELTAGWNMVSLPVIPFASSVQSVLSGAGFYQVVTWTGTGYVSVSSFEVGVGYWLLVLEDVIVEVRGTPLGQVALSLDPGWNMVGGPNTAVDAVDVFPGFHQLVTWNGYGYQTSSSFEPGKGYWALVLSETNIQLPPT